MKGRSLHPSAQAQLIKFTAVKDRRPSVQTTVKALMADTNQKIGNSVKTQKKGSYDNS